MVPILWSFLLLTLIRETIANTFACNANGTCGCSTRPAMLSRIVGGETAPNNTWGWAVSLSLNQSGLCGGSIISDSWILTAAHCLESLQPSEVEVSAATNQLYGFSQYRRASRLIIHPNYDNRFPIHDIALIQVAPAFNMSDPNIAKVCLPPYTTGDYPPVNSSLVVIGWGLLAENGAVSDTLQQVTIQRVAFEDSKCHPIVFDNAGQFCAGVDNGSKDSCDGDSGGPLMMFTENRQWVVTGIVSYGDGCANPNFSAVYTRVSYYMNWIQSMNASGQGFPATPPTCLLPTSVKNQSNGMRLACSLYQAYRLVIMAILVIFFK